MSAQASLDLDVSAIDLSRFVKFQPNPFKPRYSVAGVGRRGQEIGVCLGVITLLHAEGYEVVLQFDDGKIDSFSPWMLFPALEDNGDKLSPFVAGAV